MVKQAVVKQAAGERRQWVRARRVLSIEYSLKESKRKDLQRDSFLSTTQDMSIGGLSFYTDQEYQKGDVLEIRVVMSGVLDIFKGRVKVIRVERKATASYALVGVSLMDRKKKTASLRAPIDLRTRNRIKPSSGRRSRC
ncbi:MAG: hypothetical protein A2Z81_03330 [Omnitrophica WOR_2 bacterium GWA2_45_18]|nr:MAG: hypothetical protein A2Z81_03330 [Omnitrophica WOR_2 bacterium GWA2_45_18]